MPGMWPESSSILSAAVTDLVNSGIDSSRFFSRRNRSARLALFQIAFYFARRTQLLAHATAQHAAQHRVVNEEFA